MSKGKQSILFYIYEVEITAENKIVKKANTGIAFRDVAEAAKYCKWLNEKDEMREKGLKFHFYEEKLSVYKKAEDLMSDENNILFV